MTTCVRCNSRLDFSDVGFEPPRAGASTTLRRVRRGLGGLRLRTRERLATAGQRLGTMLHPEVDWPAVFWSIGPGLGHVRQGQRAMGLALLAIWVVLLLLTAVSVGTGWALIFAVIALGFHCTVISLLLARALSEQPVGRRIMVGLIVYVALMAVLYGPAVLAGRACFRVMPINGVRPTEILVNGDVVVCSSRWTTSRPFRAGDVVVYRVRERVGQGIVIASGWGLDRIVGVPGDRVAVEGNELAVNGTPLPPERMPIGGLSALRDIELIVGTGEYAILPSALSWRVQGEGADVQRMADRMLTSTSLVRQEDLVGRTLWRLRPWNRFGPLQ
jgi:hypothetical protein